MINFHTILNILEKSSIIIFDKNPFLFKENAAFSALLLQALVHSPNRTRYKEIIKRLINNLSNLQNPNEGYFIEKHANYYQPSALVSAIVGIALIDSLNIVDDNKDIIINLINNIFLFLNRQEINIGCYRKSYGFNYTILNSNASIILFFALYYKIVRNEILLTKINEFIFSLPKYTLLNGALTYGIYGEKYFIPSIYYHALTINHLIRIQHIVNSKKLEDNINSYLKWMKTCYNSKGIVWKKSGLIFSTYLNQVYAFILAINKILKLKDNNNIIIRNLLKNFYKGFLFRCDRTPKNYKRISISISVGIKSSDSVFIKLINIIILLFYSFLLKFNIKAKPRIYKINPLFRFLGIKSGVSPPINNMLDHMATIESYCYLATVFDLSNKAL